MEWRSVGGPSGRRPVPMVRGRVRGASDHESAATKVLRDTKFWREKGSTKVASQRGEQRALDEPSLEKAPGTILCEVGNVNSLRLLQDGSSPQGRLDTSELAPRATGFSTGRSAGLIRSDSAVAQGKALVAVGAVTKTFTTPSMETHTTSLLTGSDKPNELIGHAPCGRRAR
jgi:hypothetical protein